VSGVFTPGNTYTITVIVNGNTYTAYNDPDGIFDKNSTVLTTLVDNTYSHGQVGLYDNQPGPGGSGTPMSFSNFSVSNSGDAPLTNVDNTITGAGQLGDGQLSLVNDAAGIINGSATNNPITVDTGASGLFTNAGTVEATGAGD
jgi:hypothetical protein